MIPPSWTVYGLALVSIAHAIEPKSHSNLVAARVSLNYGTFFGIHNDSTSLLNFRGVRYAEAPVGNLRFRAPISPPSQHLGEVDASSFAPGCLQGAAIAPTEGWSEDCLFGDIYVPKHSKVNSKLPVVVYFHGGGFSKGATNLYSPELLLNAATEPFIFAIFAYRLGALGFLCGTEITEDGDCNLGILDQRAALRWVRRYIGKFGGDNERVTIWGQSAGAGSTMLHLIADGGHHRGLFHQAMGDSPPSIYITNSTSPEANELFYEYASNANCPGPNALQCLRSADISALTFAGNKTTQDRKSTSLFPFGVVVDGHFIREPPSRAFVNGNFAKVPVLFGSNTDEGYGWWKSLSSPTVDISDPDSTVDTVYNFLKGQFPLLSPEHFQKVLEIYPLAESYEGSLVKMATQIYGDMRYICTAIAITGAVHDAGLPSFGYHYDNPNDAGYTRHRYDLDAFFIFPQKPSGASGLFPIMRRYMTSFVQGGKPVLSEDWARKRANDTQWKGIANAQGTPRIYWHPEDVKMEVDDGGTSKRCEFWRSLDPELGR